MSAFFSKADVKEGRFRLSLNVCFRPEAVIQNKTLGTYHDAYSGEIGDKPVKMSRSYPTPVAAM